MFEVYLYLCIFNEGFKEFCKMSSVFRFRANFECGERSSIFNTSSFCSFTGVKELFQIFFRDIDIIHIYLLFSQGLYAYKAISVSNEKHLRKLNTIQFDVSVFLTAFPGKKCCYLIY